MHAIKAALSLALLTVSAFAAQSMSITRPAANSKLAMGSDVTVMFSVSDAPSDIDGNAAVTIALAPCDAGCQPSIINPGYMVYQGSYTAKSGSSEESFTVTVPSDFYQGTVSLNVVTYFMVGSDYEPTTNYSAVQVQVV